MVEAKLVSSATPLAPTEGRASGERLRLPYLDGLRGVASLYVVLGHVYIALVYFSDKVQLPRSLYYSLRIFNVGQTAVDVFIVLSGYCLMLPVLLNAGRLPGGVFDYFVRRAKRIFPAYYAALVLALGVIALAGFLGLPLAMPSPWGGALLSHLLLVHNFNPSWIHAFNPPMWSVAVEWQIYFALPFVLLPLWHRFGPFVSAAGGVALGLALHWLPGGRLDYSFPWYLGLFALGTLAAGISLGTSSRLVRVRQALPWMVIALALFVGLAIPFGVMPGFYRSNQLLSDQLVGLATACLLIACTKQSLEEARPSLVLQLLSSRAARWLGAISYSLYLVHYPLLEFFWHATLAIEMSASARAALLYLVFVPLVLLVANGFAAFFERPFVRKRAPAPKADVVPA